MIVALFYLAGNFIENYILTPKIIGKTIGLHPVVILLAIFSAVEFGSIVYIILAIPFVGICKIFLKHLVTYYKKTQLYKE
jgi:phosphoribosylaminoimidazole-succinocarboxamide synthase